MLKHAQKLIQRSGLLLLAALFLARTNAAQAQVLINEVYPYPGSDSDFGQDAVELIWLEKNGQTEPPNLQGWTLWDEQAHSKIIHEFTDEALMPAQFLVIPCGNKLNNGGDGVILKDAAGQIQDSFFYNSAQAGMSFSRTSPDKQELKLSLPSLGRQNSNFITLTPTPAAAEIEKSKKENTASNSKPDSSTAKPAHSASGRTSDMKASKADNYQMNAETDHQSVELKNIKSKLKIQWDKLQLLQRASLKLTTKTSNNDYSKQAGFNVQHSSPSAIIAVIIGGICLLASSLLIKPGD